MLPRCARSVLAACVLLVPSVASAEPIELSHKGAKVWVFDDVSGSIEGANWFQREPFLEAYADVEAGFLAVHPDDSQFLVVFTTWKLPAGVGALYQAVANDVYGIGYEHIAQSDPVIPEPYFDDTPMSQVQGFLHMNDWTQYLGDDEGGLDDRVISLIFGQELGHAWLAFPHYLDDVTGEIRGDLLGRAQAHWSFYLHSGGSPVEGHAWTDNGDGTFTATKQDLYAFSELDLYLMGLAPAEDVAPFFLLQDVHDCVDSALRDGSCAPADAFAFEADSYTVSATRKDITVEQIIAAEGPRVPAYGEAPTTWDVSFILVKRPDETISAGELALVDAIVQRAIDIFDAQTDGLGHVVNRTEGEPTPPPPGSGGDDTTGGDGGSGGPDDGGGAQGSAGGGPPAATKGPGLPPLANDDEEGCGCRSASPRRIATLVSLVVVLALARRRRSDHADAGSCRA